MNLKFAEVSPRLLTQSEETHSKVQRVLSLDDYGWRAPKFISLTFHIFLFLISYIFEDPRDYSSPTQSNL
jgi:hypothetical protein